MNFSLLNEFEFCGIEEPSGVAVWLAVFHIRIGGLLEGRLLFVGQRRVAGRVVELLQVGEIARGQPLRRLAASGKQHRRAGKRHPVPKRACGNFMSVRLDCARSRLQK